MVQPVTLNPLVAARQELRGSDDKRSEHREHRYEMQGAVHGLLAYEMTGEPDHIQSQIYHA